MARAVVRAVASTVAPFVRLVSDANSYGSTAAGRLPGAKGSLRTKSRSTNGIQWTSPQCATARSSPTSAVRLYRPRSKSRLESARPNAMHDVRALFLLCARARIAVIQWTALDEFLGYFVAPLQQLTNCSLHNRSFYIERSLAWDTSGTVENT